MLCYSLSASFCLHCSDSKSSLAVEGEGGVGWVVVLSTGPISLSSPGIMMHKSQDMRGRACIPRGCRTGPRKTWLERAQFSEMVIVLVSLLLTASELSARLRPGQAVVSNSSFPKEQEQLKKKPPWNGF